MASRRVRIYMPSQAMWLYQHPDPESDRTGEVLTGSVVLWDEGSKTQGRLQEWYWIEGERGSGWLPSLFGNVDFADIPPLNDSAVKHVRSEIDEAIGTLAATLRDFATWLSSPIGEGVFV